MPAYVQTYLQHIHWKPPSRPFASRATSILCPPSPPPSLPILHSHLTAVCTSFNLSVPSTQRPASDRSAGHSDRSKDCSPKHEISEWNWIGPSFSSDALRTDRKSFPSYCIEITSNQPYHVHDCLHVTQFTEPSAFINKRGPRYVPKRMGRPDQLVIHWASHNGVTLVNMFKDIFNSNIMSIHYFCFNSIHNSNLSYL